MAQDPKIMAAAWRKFSAEREARRAALAQLFHVDVAWVILQSDFASRAGGALAHGVAMGVDDAHFHKKIPPFQKIDVPQKSPTKEKSRKLFRFSSLLAIKADKIGQNRRHWGEASAGQKIGVQVAFAAVGQQNHQGLAGSLRPTSHMDGGGQRRAGGHAA